MTVHGCCDNINIIGTSQVIQSEKHLFKVNMFHCSNCGSVKATTHVKEAGMAGMKVNEFLGEKAGQTLKAEILSDVDGYNINFFINDNFQKTESFPGKSIHYVEDAAHNWINGIKVLNG